MDSPPTCSQKHCSRTVDRRNNGEFYRSCTKCRTRRAAWQRRRETERVASGNCRVCGSPCDRQPDGSLFERCARCRKRRAHLAAERSRAGICACGRPRDERPDGTLYFKCRPCRATRAKRRAQLVAMGGCPKCYYRPRAEGDSLCTVCRQNAPAVLEKRREPEPTAPRRQRRPAPYRYSRPAGPHLPPELTCRNRCRNRRDEKPDGTLYAQCAPCRHRRKRHHAELVAMGGCTKCAYRQRAEGDSFCPRCRIAKNAEYAEAKELRRLAAEIDRWAARPEPANFQPSAEDLGISRWNSRKPREATAAYWSPNPDPKPAEPGAYRYRRKFRRC